MRFLVYEREESSMAVPEILSTSKHSKNYPNSCYVFYYGFCWIIRQVINMQYTLNYKVHCNFIAFSYVWILSPLEYCIQVLKLTEKKKAFFADCRRKSFILSLQDIVNFLLTVYSYVCIHRFTSEVFLNVYFAPLRLHIDRVIYGAVMALIMTRSMALKTSSDAGEPVVAPRHEDHEVSRPLFLRLLLRFLLPLLLRLPEEIAYSSS